MATATVRFHLPAPPLRSAISTYYILRILGPEVVEDIIHPEWANPRLVLTGQWQVRFAGQDDFETLPDAALTGMLERGAVVRGSPGVLIGMGVLPEGWVRLTGQSAAGFVDRLRPLSDAFGPGVEDLLAELRGAVSDADALTMLDAFFLDLIADRPSAPPIVARAHAALVTTQPRSVDAWAASLAVSVRQLERLCQRYFGMSPKRLLRRQRFLRTLAAMRDTPPGAWSGLIDSHFVDQSHFIREFHYYLGMTPRAYFARAQPFMREAGDQRMALLGAPVQGLHAPGDGPAAR
ncbi:MAG: AraC family transcriptional regulator [Caulobacter sp.]|nr:AraC family transcriptional regulator [Caulobacter sp.]